MCILSALLALLSLCACAARSGQPLRRKQPLLANLQLICLACRRRLKDPAYSQGIAACPLSLDIYRRRLTWRGARFLKRSNGLSGPPHFRARLCISPGKKVFGGSALTLGNAPSIDAPFAPGRITSLLPASIAVADDASFSWPAMKGINASKD